MAMTSQSRYNKAAPRESASYSGAEDGGAGCPDKNDEELPQRRGSKKIPRSVWNKKRNPIAGVPTIEGRDIEFVRPTRN
jgi:hypothetical protein